MTQEEIEQQEFEELAPLLEELAALPEEDRKAIAAGLAELWEKEGAAR